MQRKSRTCGASHDALPPLLGRQMGHFVVGPSQLERKDWLQILALEQNMAFETVAEVDCMCERGLFDDIVDAGCENEAQVL